MILAIVDAGLQSPRPLEALTAPVMGEPMIWRIVERVRQARTLTRVVVAMGADRRFDAIAGWLIARGQTVFRGEGADLIGGYARCAQGFGGPSHMVQVGADTPLIDPGVIDEAVRYALSSRLPLVAAAAYPKGLDAEVMSGPALAVCDSEAQGAARASFAAFLRERPERFETASFRARRDWSGLDWRCASPAGYQLSKHVYETLSPADPLFGVEEAVEYLDLRPDLAAAA